MHSVSGQVSRCRFWHCPPWLALKSPMGFTPSPKDQCGASCLLFALLFLFPSLRPKFTPRQSSLPGNLPVPFPVLYLIPMSLWSSSKDVALEDVQGKLVVGRPELESVVGADSWRHPRCSPPLGQWVWPQPATILTGPVWAATFSSFPENQRARGCRCVCLRGTSTAFTAAPESCLIK